MRCSRARMPNDGDGAAVSSEGCTSVRARSHEVQVSVVALGMVPRTTCGRAVAAFWASSERLARFFCLVRRASRLRADSTLRMAVVCNWATEATLEP